MVLVHLDSSDFILQSININSPKLGGGSDPMVLLIKAEWCGYCNNYLPHFETYSKQYPHIKFLVFEITKKGNERLLDQWKELAGPDFKVGGFPTVVLYNGEGNPVRVVHNRFALDQELKM